MDQNRAESGSSSNNNSNGNGNTNNGNHQQNVHLHMHHVCACQGLYPTTYYPPISYRTPLIPYAAPQTVARPYLQHYQYTQFNVGSQYNMPLTPLSSYGTAGSHQGCESTTTSIAIPSSASSRGGGGGVRERGGDADSVILPCDAERAPPPEPPDFEFSAGPVIPPVNELFFMTSTDDVQMNTDGFIKFLERSCLTAEQIAYRNRNRPCFRNIQNLCIRTRSEILKPRTTISNIHSQGIPWATKDFIYAFVRLTNCWHILKGYWENREGSALGKIEKELTPGFKACYVRWEKETVELATELTRIFYNLDVNQSNPGPSVGSANIHAANNLIPPQVNLLKMTDLNNPSAKNKTTGGDNSMSCPNLMVTSSGGSMTNNTTTTSAINKNVRGILHLPSTSGGGIGSGGPNNLSAETVDQGNQTCSGDFGEENESDDDNAVVYMKPGSYRVPKNPRVIEFLETAQNVTKGLEAANDKYWVKVKTSSQVAKKIEQPITLMTNNNNNSSTIVTEPEDAASLRGAAELNADAYFNVHEWLSSSNFSDYGDRSSTSTSPPSNAIMNNCNKFSFFAAAPVEPDEMSSSTVETSDMRPVSVLQRSRKHHSQIPSRTYRNRKDTLSIMVYENKSGGLTKKAKNMLEKILFDLKATELAGLLADCVMVPVDGPNLELIVKNLNRDGYRYVNEVVRDLRYLVNSAAQYFKKCEVSVVAEVKVKQFSKRLETALAEYFPNYDFSGIDGARGEKVGKLKFKNCLFEGDGDHLKN